MNVNKLTKQEFYAMIHTVQISVPIDKEKEMPIPNAPYVNTHYEVRDILQQYVVTIIYYTQQVF